MTETDQRSRVPRARARALQPDALQPSLRIVALTLLLLSLALMWALGGLMAAEPSAKPEVTETAIFAGGCFWCTEADFEKVPGVVEAVSGYIGGEEDHPTYKQVSAGGTGHAEAVEVEFNPQKVTYEELLEVFWRSIDPTVEDRQFCDVGSQYRSGVFYRDEAQREAAERSREDLESDKPFEAKIVTEITEAGEFFPAEEYHQDYARRNPIRYKFYRQGCGRDRRLEKLWGGEG